jgi:sodium/glucose cotransporter 1/sodium/glucose cotransporter 9
MSETATATFTPTPTPTTSPDEAATIHWVDICVIVGYFVIVFATGFYFGLYKWARDKWRKYRNSRRPPTELEEEDLNIPENQTTSKSFFLAGKGVGWFAIGCSLFASNIGKYQVLVSHSRK